MRGVKFVVFKLLAFANCRSLIGGYVVLWDTRVFDSRCISVVTEREKAPWLRERASRIRLVLCHVGSSIVNVTMILVAS